MDRAEAGETGAAAAQPAAGQAKAAPKPSPLPAGPVDVDIDIPDVDTDKLSDIEKAKLSKALDTLPSPCGKAHSLRTSVKEDPECKRAPFAARFVATLADEKIGLGDTEIRQLYDGRYRREGGPIEFDLTQAPYDGPEDAKIKLVEFFDYGCPHCKAFAPVLDQLRAQHPDDVVVYYKQFPLTGNPNSGPAAQAAIAASKQGKFKEMHQMLFANQGKHDISQIKEYAEEIGLDMSKFVADYKAAAPRVAKDRAEGIKGGLQGTPTVYINGRIVERLVFLEDYIAEELAVNQ